MRKAAGGARASRRDGRTGTNRTSGFRRRLASAAVATLFFFGGSAGNFGLALRACDAYALCPFSLGCQRHLLTLWMAALVPSREAGQTDLQTTCFGEFVWKPAAAQPGRGKNFGREG